MEKKTMMSKKRHNIGSMSRNLREERASLFSDPYHVSDSVLIQC